MRISQRSIDDVREAANIVEVASEFTALRRAGARFTGLCPYPDHNEKTPSFSVTPDRGFYHCFGCLEANERIWTSRGLIPIGAAEIGDEVIGLDGHRETITDKWFRSGTTLRIRTGAAREGIELTPDHTCVFVEKHEAMRAISGLHRRGKDDDLPRFSSRLRNRVSDAALTFGHASEVRPGDFWLYPIVPEGDRADTALPGRHIIRSYTSGPRNERTTELPVNPATAWLYGVWLAEGSLYRGAVKWSFGAHESQTIAPKVSRVLKEQFNKPSTIFVRKHKNNCEVTCSSTDLSALFGHWFGSGCANKRVPVNALNWTPECQKALIQGYVDGDGHTKDGTTTASTVSEELAYGIFALCIQTRKPCSVNSTPARVGGDGVQRRKTYSLIMPIKESVKGFFAPLNGTTYYWSSVQNVQTCREQPTTVVDITTTGSHIFLTKMGATHNCQRGGDSIKLVMDLKPLPFAEAISYLADRFGIELEMEGRSPEQERAAKERVSRRRSAHKALAAAAVYYHKYLLKSPAAEGARRYLQGRGFTSSTIEEFRLGYAPAGHGAGFAGVAGKVGLDRGALESAGLLSGRGGDRFFDRITFPISDPRGRIVGFGARALGDAKPKYLNSPETELFNKRALLYGFPQVAGAVRREGSVLVVEGYTDVLMLYQCGIQNAVATLGTAMTDQHLKMLSGYADTIHLLFDPDEAGEKAVERIEKMVRTAADLKLDLRVLHLAQDPADWLLEHTDEEFRSLLSDATPVLEYVFRRYDKRLRSASVAERSRAIAEVKELIKAIADPVFRREAERLATETFGVSPDLLRPSPASESSHRPAYHPRDGRSGPSTVRESGAASTDPLDEAGRELLALMISRPDLAARPLRDGVGAPALPEPIVLEPGDFGDEAQARIFSLLREKLGGGSGDLRNGDLGAVLSDERARPLLDVISALEAAGERLYPSDAALRAAWLRVAALSRERAKAQTDDFDEKFRLHVEIKRLNRAAVEVGDLTLEP